MSIEEQKSIMTANGLNLTDEFAALFTDDDGGRKQLENAIASLRPDGVFVCCGFEYPCDSDKQLHDLIDGFRQLGVSVEIPGFPPLETKGDAGAWPAAYAKAAEIMRSRKGRKMVDGRIAAGRVGPPAAMSDYQKRYARRLLKCTRLPMTQIVEKVGASESTIRRNVGKPSDFRS